MSEHRQDALIKRYQEIHFDYSTEFKNTSTSVTRKRESMELFQSSKKMHAEEHDSSVAKLLRERSSIAASLRSVNDIIRCVYIGVYMCVCMCVGVCRSR